MYKYIIICVAILICISCKKKGCTDGQALNFESNAEKDEGSCYYSSCVFYQGSVDYFDELTGQNRKILKTEVYIFNELIGETSVVFPFGPGNCSTFGAVKYTLRSKESHDWNSLIFFEDGSTRPDGGVVRADPENECISINVVQN